MKYILAYNPNSDFTAPNVFTWGEEISRLFRIPALESPTYTFLKRTLEHISFSKTSESYLSDFAYSLLSIFNEAGYFYPYARPNKLYDEAADLAIQYGKKAWIKHHYQLDPAEYIFENHASEKFISTEGLLKNIFDIFSVSNADPQSDAYMQELTDILILAYNYTTSLTPSIRNTSEKVQQYQEKMRDNRETELRAYNDALYRIKTKNRGQIPLSSYVTDENSSKIRFNSYLDIELMSNFFRYSNGSKNPFIQNKQKLFNLKSFITSFSAISLGKKCYLPINTLYDEQLFSHNQYVLERITNLNFIIAFYFLRNKISKMPNSTSLLIELENWINFPLLTSRLHLISVLYKIFSKPLKPEQITILSNALESIREYHLYFLLPTLVQGFHYLMACVDNIPDASRKIPRKSPILKNLSNIWIELKNNASPEINESFNMIHTFKESKINKQLKQYFTIPGVKSRLTYFSPELHPLPLESPLKPIAVVQKVINKIDTLTSQTLDINYEYKIQTEYTAYLKSIGSAPDWSSVPKELRLYETKRFLESAFRYHLQKGVNLLLWNKKSLAKLTSISTSLYSRFLSNAEMHDDIPTREFTREQAFNSTIAETIFKNYLESHIISNKDNERLGYRSNLNRNHND